MTSTNAPNGPTFHERKAERKKEFEEYEKYWIEETCAACSGSGKYDHDGSPTCEGCDGTGKSKYKPRYEDSAITIESWIGKTVTIKLSDITDLTIHFRKRREIIYQFKHYIDPKHAPRIRTRLYYGYDPKAKQMDWYFKDTYDDIYYLSHLLQTFSTK